MLSLTRKVDYALVALVYLGYRQRHDAGPASARRVAETFDLPTPVLMNTLKLLARQGLVQSHRGAGGGYELARDPAELDLLEIVRSVEQFEHEHEHEMDGTHHDSPTPPRGPGPAAVQRLQRKLDGFLEQLTLADLLDEPDGAAWSESTRMHRAPESAGFVPLRNQAHATE